jgi:poly(beta-D-mannuronate) lyase
MKRFAQTGPGWLLLLAIGCCSHSVYAQRLRSPWDGQTVTMTDAPYTCPPPPAFAKSLNAESYYTDEHHSIIDPAKQKAFRDATQGPTDLGDWAGQAADAYRTSGSRAGAQCAYALLEAAAKVQAWSAAMPTDQGSYEQKWLLAAVSMAYLKVRDSGVGTADQDKAIQKWLGSVANRARDYVESKRGNPNSDAWNNHGYWAGFAVAAAGIAIDDKVDFRWGMDAYKIGVGTIRPEGALPRELDRAAMALHYHLYALAPLVMLAELGEANGVDAYAEKNGAIHLLVKLCVAGLMQPEIFQKATGVKQNVPEKISGGTIGWAVPYVKRFPDLPQSAQLSVWLRQAGTTRFWQWGGLPPD